MFSLLFLFLGISSLPAQGIRVFTTGSPENLARNFLIGEGIQPLNIRYQGSLSAVGRFGSSDELDDFFNLGVVLTTGRITDIDNENRNGNNRNPRDPQGADFDNGEGGDALLDSRFGIQSTNAAVYEIDFTAASDSITLEFLFASEEYPELTGAGDDNLRDRLGIFLIGPGLGQPLNLALVPGTATPVNSATINTRTNSGLFRDNAFDGQTAPYPFEFDGYTVPIRAGTKIPELCGTYTLRIVLADAGVPDWDSALFFNYQSFRSPLPLDLESTSGVLGNPQFPITMESCDDDILIFARRSLVDEAATYTVEFGGDATLGTDYAFDRNEFRFAVGDTVDTLRLNAFLDGITETRPESLIVKLVLPNVCDTIQQTVYITDRNVDEGGSNVSLSSIPRGPVVCGQPGNNEVELVPQTFGGASGVEHEWRDGDGNLFSTEERPTIEVTSDTTIYYRGTLPACDFPEASDSIAFTARVPDPDNPLRIDIRDDQNQSIRDTIVCPGAVLDLSGVSSGVLERETTGWSTGTQGAQVRYTVSSGDTLIFVQVQDLCNTAFDTLFIHIPEVRFAEERIAACTGQQLDLDIDVSPARGTPYTFRWLDENGDLIETGTRPSLTYEIGNASTWVVVELENFPCARDTVWIDVDDPELTLVSQPDVDSLCGRPGSNTVELRADVSGTGSAPVNYIWRDGQGNVLGSDPTLSFPATQDTLIELEVDLPACEAGSLTAQRAFRVFDPGDPLEFLLTEQRFCPGDELTIAGTLRGVSGQAQIRWTHGPTTPTITVTPQENDTTFDVQVFDLCDTINTSVTLRRARVRAADPRIELCQGMDTVLEAGVRPPQPQPEPTLVWRDSAGSEVGRGPQLPVTADTTTFYVVEWAEFPCARDTVRLEVDPPLGVRPIPDTSFCEDEIIQIAAEPFGDDGRTYFYSWRETGSQVELGTDSILTIPAVNSLDITLEVRGRCGTTVETEFRIEVIGLNIKVDSIRIRSPQPLCPGDSARLEAFVTGDPPLAFVWNGEPPTNSRLYATPLDQTQDITLEVSNECFTVEQTVTVEVHPPLSVSAPEDTTVCGGDTLRLRALASGGDGEYANWQWTDTTGTRLGDEQTLEILPDPADTLLTYIVDAADGCGQTARDTVEVRILPGLEINTAQLRDTSFCPGEPVQFAVTVTESAGTPTFSWRNQETNTEVSDQSIASLNPADTTRYELTVTDDCQTRRFTFTLRPIPLNLDILEVTILPDTIICPDTEITYVAEVAGGSGSYTYIWGRDTTGSATYTRIADRARLQLLDLRVDDGCSVQDTTLRVERVPDFFIEARSSRTDICRGRSVRLTGEANPTGTVVRYQWRTAGGTSLGDTTVIESFTPDVNTEVIFEVEDSCGTIKRDTILLRVTPLPQMDAGPDQVICDGTGVQLEGSFEPVTLPDVQVVWAPATGLSDPRSLTTEARPTETTTYVLSSLYNGCLGRPDTVVVRVSELAEVFLPKRNFNLCRGDSVWLEARVDGGTPPLSYAWTPTPTLGQPDSLRTAARPNSTQTYAFTASDTLGCTTPPQTATVVVHPTPVADAGPDRTVCAGEVDTLAGGISEPLPDVALRYAWQPATGLSDPQAPNPVVRAEATTTYTLTVISEPYGCLSPNSDPGDDQATVTVTVLPRPEADAGADTALCEGQTVRIGTVSGREVSHIWSPAQSLDNPTAPQPLAQPQQTTTYFLRTVVGSCTSAVDRVTVRVKGRPIVRLPEGPQICPGDSITLSPLVQGGEAPYAFDWQPPEGLSDPAVATPTAFPDRTQTYTLNVTAAGCSALEPETVEVEVVPVPLLEMPPTQELVSGESVELVPNLRWPPGASPTPLNIQWLPAGTLSEPDSLRTVAQPAETTTYTLTLAQAGCQVSDTVRVNVVPPDTFTARLFTSHALLCRGARAVLTLTSTVEDVVFEWLPEQGFISRNARGAVVEPLFTTEYRVVARLGTRQDTLSVRVEVVDKPRAEFDFGITPGCGPTEVRFRDNSVYATHWHWDFGAGLPPSNEIDPSVTYTRAGAYPVRLVVTGVGSCRDTAVRTVVIPAATPLKIRFRTDPRPQSTLRAGQPLRLTDETPGARTHLWELGDGSTYTQVSALHTYARSGRYPVRLTVTDDAGCSYTREVGTFFVFNPDEGIPNVFTPNNDGQNDRWQLLYSGPGAVQIRVLDDGGRVVFETTDVNQGWDGTDSIGRPLPEGIYYYIITIDGHVFRGALTLIR